MIAVRTLYRRVQQQQQEGMPRETRVLSVVFVSCDTTATKRASRPGFEKYIYFIVSLLPVLLFSGRANLKHAPQRILSKGLHGLCHYHMNWNAYKLVFF